MRIVVLLAVQDSDWHESAVVDRFSDYVLQLWIFYISDNLYFYFMVM